MSTKKSDLFGWGPNSIIPPNRLEFLKNLARGKKILDIGCGPGHFVNYLLDHNFTATGVDKKFTGKNIVKTDAVKLPFANNSFDTAYLCNILEHNPHDDQILKEALRVSPRIIITVPQAAPPNLRGRGVVYLHYQDQSHLRNYTPASLKKLANSVNAKIIKIIPIEPLPNRELFYELFTAPLLIKKIISHLVFFLLKKQPYYLELAAVIKRK